MMQKFLFQKKQASDRGVALLFALGILSALMLLGIAFMGSSLFSRRVAENRSNGNEARLLARSAANLVAGAVMMYETQIGDDPLPQDFRAVFSRVESSDDPSGKEGIYWEFLRGYTRVNNTVTGYSRLDVGKRAPYHGDDSMAQWLYVHDSDGNIIGRYAYQVLPKLSLNRINFYQMESGSVQNLALHTETPDAEEYPAKPQQTRFGQEIGEIIFPDGDFKMEFNDQKEISAYFSDLYASGLGLEQRSDYKQRAWLESNFIEGTTPTFHEVAPEGLRRFNLTAWKKTDDYLDPWLVRFEKTSDDVKSGADAFLKTMTEKSAESDEYPGKIIYDDEEGQTVASRGGLPFLRLIGNRKESFASLADLRRQIAANFNDYCDSDSIPTSDQGNATWDPDMTTPPAYTGNERTLSINEIVYGLVGRFTNTSGKVALNSADLVWGAELIDVYGDQSKETPENLSAVGYTLKGGIKSGTAEIVLEPTVDFEYKIEVTDKSVTPATTQLVSAGTIQDQKVSRETMGDATATHTVTWSESTLTISNFSDAGGAYKMGAIGKDDAPKSTSATWDFSKDNSTFVTVLESLAKEKDQNKLSPYADTSKYTIKPTITSVTVKKICPTVSKLELTPKNMVLSDGTNNVDYTTIQKNSTSPAINISENNLQTNDYLFDTGGIFSLRLFVGGMEAKDPRQNLNVNFGNTSLASDWTWSPAKIYLNADTVIHGAGATLAEETATLDAETTEEMASQIAGKSGYKNSEANPHTATNADPESVEDPGWSSNSESGMISTAVIRNAPMKSPWELGFIHRGAQFQTINLKKAETVVDKDIPTNFDESAGTEYSDGDAGILDWIKMTGRSHSYGKINFRQYFKDDSATSYTLRYDGKEVEVLGSDWKKYDEELVDALYRDIPDDKAVDFVKNSADTGYSCAAGTKSLTGVYGILQSLSRSDMTDIDRRSKLLTKDAIRNKLVDATVATDAEQEKWIGRTFNLITVNTVKPPPTELTEADPASYVEPPPVFYAVIIAQCIKDVGGGDALSSDHPTADPKPTTLGVFDMPDSNSNPKDNAHYDVITGEAKILVTYERNPMTGQVIIRDIENIE